MITLTKLLAITFGGGVGALLRFLSNHQVTLLLGHNFPYGILIVNIVGSFLIGLGVVVGERLSWSPELQAGIIIGVLGGFTTFSSFSLDTIQLLESGSLFKASLNVILNVLLCLSGCFLGLQLGRQLW